MCSIYLFNPDAWIQLSQPVGSGLHRLQRKKNMFVSLMDLTWAPNTVSNVILLF